MKTNEPSTSAAIAAIESHCQNLIDCEGGTIMGPWAHTLYFRKDYHDTQNGPNRFAVYYVGENRSELHACQTTLEGALKYMGAYCVLVILKAHDWQKDKAALWDKIVERSNASPAPKPNLSRNQTAVAAIRLHPMTETNVDAMDLSHGSVMVECDNSELEYLRLELADREQEVRNLEAAAEESDKLSAVQVVRIRSLEWQLAAQTDLLAEVKDDKEGTLTDYRERAEHAAQIIKDQRSIFDASQDELTALRKKKGVFPGYFDSATDITNLLRRLCSGATAYDNAAEARKICAKLWPPASNS